MKIVITGYEQEQPTLGYYTIDSKVGYKQIAQKELASPSFIVRDHTSLFTFQTNNETTLLSLMIEEDEFIEKDRITILGGKPTHLVYSTKNKLLFGCSYTDGTIFSVGCANGQFETLITYKKQVTTAIKSHCHCVLLNNNETILAVINIATDQVFFYQIDEGILKEGKVLQLPLNIGPRHGIYNEDCSLLYIVTEYSNEVVVIQMPSFTILQRTSTIPHYNNTSYGATLVFSLDYQYLYVSNRGEDAIAKFKVLSDGLLEYDHSFSCGGAHPRHMILSRDGDYIISCNKNSNHVAIIDLATEEVVLKIPFLSPSGVVEVEENS